jgi:hypothetical protein
LRQFDGGAQSSHTSADYEEIRIHPLQAMIAGGNPNLLAPNALYSRLARTAECLRSSGGSYPGTAAHAASSTPRRRKMNLGDARPNGGQTRFARTSPARLPLPLPSQSDHPTNSPGSFKMRPSVITPSSVRVQGRLLKMAKVGSSIHKVTAPTYRECENHPGSLLPKSPTHLFSDEPLAE